jgi:hypothetical protein
MNRVLAIAAAGEAVTGLALLVSPPTVARLLLGAEVAGAGIWMSRVAGIALIALGITCWPGTSAIRSSGQAYGGMSTYSALVSLCLVYVGLAGESTGKLLWPAAVAHVILTVLLALAWCKKGTAMR